MANDNLALSANDVDVFAEVGNGLLEAVTGEKDAPGTSRKQDYAKFRAKLGDDAYLEKQRESKDVPSRVTRAAWRCVEPLNQWEYKRLVAAEKKTYDGARKRVVNEQRWLVER